jgi:hypothetical protein
MDRFGGSIAASSPANMASTGRHWERSIAPFTRDNRELPFATLAEFVAAVQAVGPAPVLDRLQAPGTIFPDQRFS